LDQNLSIVENDTKSDVKNSAQSIKSVLIVLIILLVFLGVVSAIKPYKYKFDRNINKN
jgi:hypothetical protein